MGLSPSPLVHRTNEAPVAYQPLVTVLAAVCGGIVVDRYLALALAWSWPAAVIAWLTWWTLWRRGYDRLAVAPLLLSLAAAGAAWHHCRWSLFDAREIGLAAADVAGPAAIEARIVEGPRRIPAPPYNPLRSFVASDRTRFDVEVLAVRDDATWRPSSGRATLFVNGYTRDARPGDRVRVFAQLARVEPPANPGEFDFAGQARVERRLCWLSSEFPECVTRLASGSAWSWPRVLWFLRAGGDALLWRNLRPGRSGLASAMFLGSREELQPDETQAFLETGTIHLLVISGLNVGILAGCLLLAMRAALVPQRFALAAVAAACVLYAATTDAQPPVVRATVMVLVACAAATLGRRALAYNSIAAAGLVVLALNPHELFQSGTQLSFLSVVALAWLAEERLRRRDPDPLARLIAASRPWHHRAARRATTWAWRLVLTSLVIWIVIAPLVMARFHLVSPVAIVLGPLLGMPVALAMAAGFGIFIVGWIAPPLAAALGWVCDVNLAFMHHSVEAARGVRGGHLWVSGPGEWWLAGFYGAILAAVLVPRFAPPRRWCLALMAGWIALGFSLSLAAPRDPQRLDCTFLSVGHGAAVVIELPGGQTLLYDAGRLGSPTYAARAVSGYLWSRGIRRLDAVIISHADADHFNALPALLDQFTLGAVYVSPVMFEGPSPALLALREAIDRVGVPLAELQRGDRLRVGGGAGIEVLHPPRGGVLGSDNANSVVLSIEYQGRRLLLTGDLEPPGLDDVMAEEPLDCDVLLAPHHGSAASDPPGFAAWSTPEWTVISAARRHRPPAVATAYAARGGRVLDTATSGAVRVSIANHELTVDCWHAGFALSQGRVANMILMARPPAISTRLFPPRVAPADQRPPRDARRAISHAAHRIRLKHASDRRHTAVLRSGGRSDGSQREHAAAVDDRQARDLRANCRRAG
jgi:competence protein ComEC